MDGGAYIRGGGGMAYNRTNVSKCSMVVLIKILFEFIRFS